MATSTLMKFSLLAIIVILNSYISSTEALDPCPIPNGASSTVILTAVNCTITRCDVASAGCTGTHCFKIGIIIGLIRTLLYPLIVSHVGTCGSCPLSTIIGIRAVLLLIVLLIAKLIEFLLLALRTVALVLAIITLIVSQLASCVLALGSSVTAVALAGGCNTVCNNGINAMLTSIP